jgi:hypothetical protein
MKTLLYSLCLAAGLATAVTAMTAPSSQARNVGAAPDTPITINRAARADRLPVAAPAPIVVKTFPVRPVQVRRHQSPPKNPPGCEAVVSPLADVAASRQLRQCMT